MYMFVHIGSLKKMERSYMRYFYCIYYIIMINVPCKKHVYQTYEKGE